MKELEAYGHYFPETCLPLTIEMCAFKHGWGPDDGGLGKYQHFLNCVKAIWPYDPKKSKTGVQINPWSEMIWEELCRWQYLAVSGPKSSGKTEALAIWGLINWWCDPLNTLVLMTSTSMKEARKRIWGAARERFMQGAAKGMPGKLVDSMGIIRIDDGQTSDRASISLLPSSPEKEKEATAKIIGMKQKRVFLLGDEMTDISHSVTEAAFGNLDANLYFQFVGLGNYKSDYDPFGSFAEPKHGWNSVSVEDDRWLTKRGMCLHLDGMKTPNALSDPEDKWPFLYRKRDLDAALERGEENTIQFWRFVRSFPAPTGAEASIYTEADIRKGKATEQPVWDGTVAPIPVAGFDPGFTNGGDKSKIYFILYGRTKDGMTVHFHECVEINEDVRNPEPRSFQIAKRVIEECNKRKVLPKHLAVDATGAGDPLCDVIDGVWGARVMRVKFSSSPTETPAGRDNPLPASEVYMNRATELWYSGVEFLRSGQFRGITPSLAREMTARLYSTEKRGKLSLEPKVDMKARIGRSPDEAEAAFLGLDVCRQRLGALAGGIGGRLPQDKAWKKLVKRLDVFSPSHLGGSAL